MLSSFRLLNFHLLFLLYFLTSSIYGKDAPLNFSIIASKISGTPHYEFLDREAFDLLELSNEDWSSVTIGEAFIPAPRTAGEILTYLRQVESVLTSSKEKTISFQYGDREAITLKLPFLGRGNNGAVYEIEGPSNKESKVIKITLPRLQGIESSIIEYESLNFWVEAAKNSDSFLVPGQHEAHKLGFYRIMEKNEGITLTKYLLMLGAIHIDSALNKTASYNPNFLDGLYASEARQIADAIQSMITVINENPKHCVSLSPNNIHITYDPGSLAIKRIDLVDIGPVPSKLKSYQQLKTFNQFLELCAERLQKYLSIPEYRYDVSELQRYQALYTGPEPLWRRKHEPKPKNYDILD